MMGNCHPKKQSGLMIVLSGVICLAFVWPGNGHAQDIKQMGNLNFRVPDEWPVEKKGGLVMPVPTEEYVTMKFKEIEKEFLAVRSEMAETFGRFELTLMNMEKDLSKETKKFESENEAQKESSAELTAVLSGIESLKGELARLDEKMTAKINSIESRLDVIDPDIGFIKENLNGLQMQIYRLDEKVDYIEEGQERSY
jgi:uncharacterized phage infection (PIP) family protein YhgE